MLLKKKKLNVLNVQSILKDPTKISSSSAKKSKRKGKDEKTPRKQQNGDDSGSHSPNHDSDMENGSPEKVTHSFNKFAVKSFFFLSPPVFKQL